MSELPGVPEIVAPEHVAHDGQVEDVTATVAVSPVSTSDAWAV